MPAIPTIEDLRNAVQKSAMKGRDEGGHKRNDTLLPKP